MPPEDLEIKRVSNLDLLKPTAPKAKPLQSLARQRAPAHCNRRAKRRCNKPFDSYRSSRSIPQATISEVAQHRKQALAAPPIFASGGTIAKPVPMYGTLPTPHPWPISGNTCSPSDDDCEEFVPLSQEVNLMNTFALPRAMDFMPDGGSIAPPPTHPTKVVKVMIESQDVDMTTGIEQPSGTHIEQPINNTSQEQPSGNVSQKASKRPRQIDGPAKENEDILNELEQEVGTNSGVTASTTQNPISSMDFTELEGVSGSKVKQSKRSLLGVVNRTMGEGMTKLCDTLRDVEDKHNATLRELEASRHALEERLLRIREEEEDTKRQQIYLSTQLELAKILAKVRDYIPNLGLHKVAQG
ncbi:hypothetical protein GOP47_0004763 [Adiantum capillus-veneris]|uniref:Uncharacterized protein n=1 Tax=Adiantum capillus-veneris TaxID=13818 RepID=A0A9D4ZKX8_ADICA|nr:hypothetical protein GOP47_0004763 [Adiantum capillus-veneris]